MVEGKIKEHFGKTVEEWLMVGKRNKNGGYNRQNRLKEILNDLGFKNFKTDLEKFKEIKYQLLHRTISAYYEAKKFNAKYAIILIHSFNEIEDDSNYRDFKKFMQILGINSSQRNEVIGPYKKEDIKLYFVWVDDK